LGVQSASSTDLSAHLCENAVLLRLKGPTLELRTELVVPPARGDGIGFERVVDAKFVYINKTPWRRISKRHGNHYCWRIDGIQGIAKVQHVGVVGPLCTISLPPSAHVRALSCRHAALDGCDVSSKATGSRRLEAACAAAE